MPLGTPPPVGPGFTGQILRSTPLGTVPSLYLHVPFCFHKCHYCDFYSIVDTQDRQAVFADRLCRELRALAPWATKPLRTIFVGGGTPSLLAEPLWRKVLAVLAGEFDLSVIRAGHGEFTVECNPETVSPELMATLCAGGVDRVSIGAQSFHANHLKTLERWHDPANVARAIDLARAAGIHRQSLDLIYAVPGQTLAQWDADLRTALALGTEHMSCYALTYEPQTAMTARWQRGEFARADEDIEADMFEHTVSTLRAAGLDRYEVSNFAKPGAECRHNLAYWRQEQWLAAGPSASAHVAGHRWKNLPRLDDYLRQDQDGFAAITDHEPPNPARALGEILWTGLRTREGVSPARVHTACAALSPATEQRVRALMDRLAAEGLLAPRKSDADAWALNDAGLLIADRVAVRCLRAVDDPGV